MDSTQGKYTDKGFESRDIQTRLQNKTTLLQKVTLPYLTSNESNNVSLQDFGVNHIAVGEDEKRKAFKFIEIKISF